MRAWLLTSLFALGALLLARPAAASAKPAMSTGTRPTAPPPPAPPPATGPRGIRNHNPFNLRPDSRWTWQGQAGVDNGPGGGYLIFAAAQYGLRAGFINLANQQLKHGLRTVRAIISKYAPSSDNNDTAAYIAAVARALGVGPDAQLDLTDRATLTAFAAAVIKHENGQQPYTSAQLAAAYMAAGVA